MSRKKKVAERERASTRELIAVNELTECSLKTDRGELVFFAVKPTNISVLSEESIRARVYALMTVLKGVAEIEMLCLNSRENFDENKRYLRERIAAERVPALRALLEQDLAYLDRIQVQMATAREFFIITRRREESGADLLPHLAHIEKGLKDQGFTSHRAGQADLKRLLAMYFEQNATTEYFEDVDGERWVIPEDV